jgi:hypothetical protein
MTSLGKTATTIAKLIQLAESTHLPMPSAIHYDPDTVRMLFANAIDLQVWAHHFGIKAHTQQEAERPEVYVMAFEAAADGVSIRGLAPARHLTAVQA